MQAIHFQRCAEFVAGDHSLSQVLGTVIALLRIAPGSVVPGTRVAALLAGDAQDFFADVTEAILLVCSGLCVRGFIRLYHLSFQQSPLITARHVSEGELLGF